MPLFALPFSIEAMANEQQKINERLNDSRIQAENVNTAITPEVTPQIESKVNEASKITITRAELEKRPDLVLRALQPALIQGNSDTLNIIFPIYQQLDSQYHQPIFDLWAEAILAKSEHNYTRAIQRYRVLIADYPDNVPARLQLAIALFGNNEIEAAEDQFQKLRATQLPPEIMAVIESYLDAIYQRDRWTFNGGITYLRDPNINNAPKSGTTYAGWLPPARESAEGIGFNFNLSKKWSWGNGFYNALRLNNYGKYYWDNRKYNEFTTRGSFGQGFQNAKFDLALYPFIEQTFYAGGSSQSETLKRFSKAGGATLETHYWLNPQWQINGHYEYAEQRYVSRKHLNGNMHYLALGGFYLANAKRYFFGNLHYHRNATRDSDDSYFRRGITLGWQQEWGWGLSTRLSTTIAQKRYKGEMPIFRIVQRNKEYSAQASIWHRALHYWGITPRLTYSVNRTRSNHVFYSYDKQRVFIDFNRTF